jgi:hypothetical protein
MALNREVEGQYLHKERVHEGKAVVDARDPRVPGYREPRKYTKRTWESE